MVYKACHLLCKNIWKNRIYTLLIGKKKRETLETYKTNKGSHFWWQGKIINVEKGPCQHKLVILF